MPRRSFKDFTVASEDSIAFSEWKNLDGQPAIEDKTLNQKWDPYNFISLSTNVSVDTKKLLQSTNLTDKDTFRIIASWHSPGTTLKGAGKNTGEYNDFIADKDTLNFEVKLNVDGSLVGEKLFISLKLCLVKKLSTSPISPAILGSVLWENTNEIILEGEGSLFPMEVHKFPKSYSNASWYLEMGEMSATVSAGLRLHINDEKKELINSINSKESSTDFSKIIYCDVARQIIITALQDTDFRSVTQNNEEQVFANGTVGKCAFDLIKIYLKKSPMELYNQYQLNPLEFERDIQHSFSNY